MTKPNNQSGFSPLIVILLIATVVAVGVIGWRVWDAQQNTVVTSESPKPNPVQNKEQSTPSTDKTFKSAIKPIGFQYPQDWTNNIKNDSEFENGFLYSPDGKKYAEFIANLHNFGSSCDDTPYMIIRADEISTAFPGHTIYYLEEIRGKDLNGQYSVSYSLSDKVPSRQTNPTSGCTAYPGYIDLKDGNGYIVFRGGTSVTEQHFQTYNEALAFFTSADYLKAKAAILSLRHDN